MMLNFINNTKVSLIIILIFIIFSYEPLIQVFVDYLNMGILYVFSLLLSDKLLNHPLIYNVFFLIISCVVFFKVKFNLLVYISVFFICFFLNSMFLHLLKFMPLETSFYKSHYNFTMYILKPISLFSLGILLLYFKSKIKI